MKYFWWSLFGGRILLRAMHVCLDWPLKNALHFSMHLTPTIVSPYNHATVAAIKNVGIVGCNATVAHKKASSHCNLQKKLLVPGSLFFGNDTRWPVVSNLIRS